MAVLPASPKPESGTHLNRKFRIILFPVLLVLVLLLAGAGIFFYKARLQNTLLNNQSQQAEKAFIEKYRKEASSLKFLSQMWKDRFLENLDKAGKEFRTEAKYQFFADDFEILKVMYINSHDPKVRKLAEEYARFLAKEYVQEYQKDIKTLTVECLDTECGVAKYPTPIETIKNEVAGNSSLNKSVQAGILKNFEAAAISAEKGNQWDIYRNTFALLKSEYNRTKDEKIRQTAIKLRDFMKQEFDKEFKRTGLAFPEALTI